MQKETSSVSNIYRLDGRVPLLKAIPFGIQHILAMFVANLTPITIIAAAGGLSQSEIAVLLQNAMFVAGIATLIQLYPVWKVGSKLPIVMGVSFTFVTVLSTVAVNYGYPAVIGAVLIGGINEIDAQIKSCFDHFLCIAVIQRPFVEFARRFTERHAPDGNS